MNNCTFISNVGRDAEVRFLQNGTAVAQFSIAVNSGYGDKQTTSWVNCAMYGDRAEKVAPYIAKGSRIGVSGEISLRTFKAKDGTEKTSLELRVNELTLLGNKDDKPAKENKPQARKTQSDGFDNMDDDIPF